MASTGRRIQFCDTAECNSALRSNRAIALRRFDETGETVFLFAGRDRQELRPDDNLELESGLILVKQGETRRIEVRQVSKAEREMASNENHTRYD